MSGFRTSVSEVVDGGVNLRGYALETVITDLDHTSGIFLTLIGRLPDAAEHTVLEALLNTLLDHGFVASTIATARYAASGNPQFIPAVAAGLLACGSNTVSPWGSYEMLRTAGELRHEKQLNHDEAGAQIVREYTDRGERLPGFGHPTHKRADFRADAIFEIAQSAGLGDSGIMQYKAIQRQMSEITHRHLPINIDGAMAAVGFDMGWSAMQTVAFAILSVLPGLMAHVIEEIEDGAPLRHINDGKYSVAPLKPLPTPWTDGG